MNAVSSEGNTRADASLQVTYHLLGLAGLLVLLSCLYLFGQRGSSLAVTVTGCVFATALFLLFGIRRNISILNEWNKREMARRLQEADEEKHNLERRVEERTFELAAINASLNRQIAEKSQAEAELKRIGRRMELILNAAGDGILGLDKEGRVTFVNNAALIMLGWSSEELLGRNHHDVVHHTRSNGSPYSHQECPIEASYRDGAVRFASDEVFWCNDGTSFPVEYVSTPIVEDGKVTGAVVVFRDISDRSMPA